MHLLASVRRIGASAVVRAYGASGDLLIERDALTPQAAIAKVAREVGACYPRVRLTMEIVER